MQKDRKNIEQIVFESAKRWLHSINLDAHSKYYGMADREYWAWKTKDFNNSTWQGGLSGFLDASPLFDLDKSQLAKVVDACIAGTMKTQRTNGSFEEAYPFESSLCVTGLVIFNLAYSYLSYKELFSNKTADLLCQIIEKACCYLNRNSESHGIISNHIATIELAILLAQKVLKQPLEFTRWRRFIKTQHLKEGWFTEYLGADPGYQTLLMHYWRVASQFLNLKEYDLQLQLSTDFIARFALPNGDFAGELGSRGTSIFYPSCMPVDTQTPLNTWFLEQHIVNLESVNPLNIDANNFVPVFNAWAFFYKNLKSSRSLKNNKKRTYEYLKGGGFIFLTYPKTKVIISLNTGCIKYIKFINKQWEDCSIASFNNGSLTTQGLPLKNIQIEDNKLKLIYQCHYRNEMFNTPFKTILMRLISATIYKFPLLQRIFKKLLVLTIMTKSKALDTNINVIINLSEETFRIDIENPENWQITKAGFYSHMASANTFRVTYVS